MFLSRFAALVTMASCPFTLHAQTYVGRPGTSSSTTHAGGTVVVAVSLSDGLVLAADSRLTITFPKGVTPEYKVASDYAPKLFNIGQVAIASFGDAFVSARSIASYISELEASLKGSPPALMSMR
jgi:20S proteasome alpha/beta subunit